MSQIKVYLTPEERDTLPTGRFYIEVKVKIPTIILSVDAEIPFIPPSLDPSNSPYHSSPLVALAETHSVIFDITGHPECPAERTVAAADRFLNEHYPELDRALRGRLREISEG